MSKDYDGFLKEAGSYGFPEALTDEDGVRVVGVLLLDGFISSLDWNTPLGEVFINIIDENWEAYTSWKESQEA